MGFSEAKKSTSVISQMTSEGIGSNVIPSYCPKIPTNKLEQVVTSLYDLWGSLFVS